MTEPLRLQVRFASDPAEAMLVQAQVVDWLKERNFPAREVFGVRLALEEGMMNAIKHGNQRDTSKFVRILCEVDATRAYIEIEDQGLGFEPSAVPDPLADENLEKPSGRGMFLMRQYMTYVEYRDSGRLLVLEIQFPLVSQG